MEAQIKSTLTAYFEDKRIVFWYDDKNQFREDFDDFDLPNVKKIILENNEFNVKYRVLREEPAQKFLIYHAGPRPEDLQNWLLDILLANIEFKTEQTALWLTDLGLGYEHLEIPEKHSAFFKDKKRRESLKSLVNSSEDTTSKIKLKMLAVCANSEADIESILEILLNEYSKDKDDKINLIERCNLKDFLFDILRIKFNYISNAPSIKDFILQLLNSAYKNEVGATLNKGEQFLNDAYVFLKRWKDSRQYEEAFEKISNEIAEILDIETDIDTRNYKELIESDSFLSTDKKILYSLTQEICKKTISKDECLLLIRQRKNKRWSNKKEVKNAYQALWFAALFMNEFITNPQFEINDLNDGIEKYTKNWQKIDYYYRKFIYFSKETGQTTLFENLNKEIENTYSNKYLLKLNDNWQQQIDKSSQWSFADSIMQKNFFKNHLKMNISKNNKLFVIISDAMRYEIGDELVSLIRQEDRFEAKISPSVTSIPSYTQLGMAALLPNEEILIDNNVNVLVDNINSQGTDARKRILKTVSNINATAQRADDILKMGKEELRDIFRENDVMYIYHDRIDAVGHDQKTEERTVEATEDALAELIKLIKKLTGANASNIIVTADHGFIYQNEPLTESDYLGDEAEGEVLFSDRRFVIGKGLVDKASLKKYKASEIGLQGDLEFQFPKSINRLRKRGASSRFVHGGLSLQEIIIPIVQINKKRQSDTGKVEVEILKSNNIISSNQLAVKFYQSNSISDKLQPRTLRVGIYNKNNDLLSDVHELTFDYTSENARDREFVVSFILKKKIDDANGQEVKLKLEENEPGTEHYKEYKSTSYMVRKTFTTDFDF